MNYTDRQKKEIFKLLQELKENVQETLDFALENIDSIHMDSYFTAEDHLERITKGLIKLEEDFEENFTLEKLKQFETRLFFLEDRFEEVDAELRQKPRRRKRPRIGLHNFFRFSQGERLFSSGGIQTKEEAFAILNLNPDTPLKIVTAKFRKMAKELHPDSRGGDRSQEPELRKLISAYQFIKDHFAPE